MYPREVGSTTHSEEDGEWKRLLGSLVYTVVGWVVLQVLERVPSTEKEVLTITQPFLHLSSNTEVLLHPPQYN